MTTAEIRAQATEAVFAQTWSNKWTDQIRVKSKANQANTAGSGNTGNPGAPVAKVGPVASANKKPTSSLFAV